MKQLDLFRETGKQTRLRDKERNCSWAFLVPTLLLPVKGNVHAQTIKKIPTENEKLHILYQVTQQKEKCCQQQWDKDNKPLRCFCDCDKGGKVRNSFCLVEFCSSLQGLQPNAPVTVDRPLEEDRRILRLSELAVQRAELRPDPAEARVRLESERPALRLLIHHPQHVSTALLWCGQLLFKVNQNGFTKLNMFSLHFRFTIAAFTFQPYL